MNKNYAIEARSLNIAGFWSHNFWVLRHPNGEVMGELHGLATDRRNGQFVPIGTNEHHSLRAWHFTSAKHSSEVGVKSNVVNQHAFYEQGQRASTLLMGDVNTVMPRWRAAAKSVDFINGMDLNYPAGGVKVTGKTKNSNSMYTTMGDIMGLPRFSFWQVFEPGISTPVLIPDLVDAVLALSGEVWDSPVHSPVPSSQPAVNSSPAIPPPNTLPMPRGGGRPPRVNRGGVGYRPGIGNSPPRGRVSIPFVEITRGGGSN
jgi:hypothetical protein